MFNDIIFFRPNNTNEITVSCLEVPTVPVVHRISPVDIHTTENGSIAISDKKNAHSIFELMLVNSSDTIKETILKLNKYEYRTYFDVVHSFFEFVTAAETINNFSLAGGVPRIVFNHDPDTDDRESLQPVKRFHSHLYIVTQGMLNSIRANCRTLKDVSSPFMRRTMVDPLSLLSENILYDIVTSSPVIPPNVKIVKPNHVRKIQKGDPFGVNIHLNEGIRALQRDEVRFFLLGIFHQMETCFNEIRAIFLGDHANACRANLQDLNAITDGVTKLEWLSLDTKRQLISVAEQLRPLSMRLLKTSRHSRLKSNYLISKGLAYTFSITASSISSSNESSPLIVNISPRFFSDTGGAGLFGCEGISAIYLKRGEGLFSEKELLQRWEFQDNFMNYFAKKVADRNESLEMIKMSSNNMNKMLNVYYHNKEMSTSQELLKDLVEYYRLKNK